MSFEEKDVRMLQLSPRAENSLIHNGKFIVRDILPLDVLQLMRLSKMGKKSALEIVERIQYLYSKSQDRNDYLDATVNFSGNLLNVLEAVPEIYSTLMQSRLRVAELDLPLKAINRLNDAGIIYFSDLLNLSFENLEEIPGMSITNAHIVYNFNFDYFLNLIRGETEISALIEEVETEPIDLSSAVFDCYTGREFDGLTFTQLIEEVMFKTGEDETKVSSQIQSMISENRLIFEDQSIYRKYESLENVINNSPKLKERDREIIRQRQQGYTLETVGKCFGITRERARQIEKKLKKAIEAYLVESGDPCLSEDYYRYLYSNYDLSNQDHCEKIGISNRIRSYFSFLGISMGEKDLFDSLEDTQRIDSALRLKIKAALSNEAIFVNGEWIPRRRRKLEEYVIRNFCKEDTDFDEFVEIYNSFIQNAGFEGMDEFLLEQNDQNYIRARKTILSDFRCLLWKYREKFRFYDIDGTDFTHLWETIHLDSFENIEISTALFLRKYPEIMQEYDIRDEYELHNIIRKTLENGSFHNLKVLRMPNIGFGNYDFNQLIFKELVNNVPISQDDFVSLLSDKFGFRKETIMGTYLIDFSKYYHNGMFDFPNDSLSEENKAHLSVLLKDDFYYMDEVRKIYLEHFPSGKLEDLTPYNLKSMGWQIRNGYVFRNSPSSGAYFRKKLTENEHVDLKALRGRYGYIIAFTDTLSDLKSDLILFEYEQNKGFLISYLVQRGITKAKIESMISKIYDFTAEKEYFTIKSIRQDGFAEWLEACDLGDDFYSYLIASQKGFVSQRVFGTHILKKKGGEIRLNLFLDCLVKQHQPISLEGLISILENRYGFTNIKRDKLITSLKETTAKYDPIRSVYFIDHELEDEKSGLSA